MVLNRSPTADLRWHVWNPATAVEHSELVSAIADFEASATVLADKDAKTWLKDKALSAYPGVVTYVAVRGGLVEGFFALTSAQVALTMRRRPRFLRTHDRNSLQEAVLITAMGRRQGASLSDYDILLHIIGAALSDTHWPRAIALFAMAGSAAFTDFLTQNHFQSISGSGPGRLFWFPLPNTLDALPEQSTG